jgi:hypothetical protein
MTPTPSPYSIAAAELARDALDQGDEALRTARNAGSPVMRRSTGVGRAVAADDTLTRATTPDGSTTPRSIGKTRADSRRDYETAHNHYLNAASLYYTGLARESDETALQTIARLPDSVGNALRSAYEDYGRESHREAAGRDGGESVLEQTDRYLARLRAELESQEPRVFGGNELLASETSPTR